jgi:hypothetical protein
MFDSILLEATDALLAQQAEIKRLHSIISWCKPRLAVAKASELEALLRERASKPPQLPRKSPAFARSQSDTSLILQQDRDLPAQVAEAFPPVRLEAGQTPVHAPRFARA